jgi:dsRNA-specific ribonuclease
MFFAFVTFNISLICTLSRSFRFKVRSRLPLRFVVAFSNLQHLPYDYERLENLGDSFLKILITVHIFAQNPTFHEGRLTSMRNVLEGNRLFTKRAVKTGILGSILCKSLTRILWSPLIRQILAEEELAAQEMFFMADVENKVVVGDAAVAMEVTSDVVNHVNGNTPVVDAMQLDVDVNALEVGRSQIAQQTGSISDKTIADCLEALVGTGVLVDSIRGGSRVAQIFLDDDYKDDWILGYGSLLRVAGCFNQPSGKSDWFKHTYEKVEKAIGYVFKNKNLIVEALTHPSAVTEEGNCYQRLEFLGLSLW